VVKFYVNYGFVDFAFLRVQWLIYQLFPIFDDFKFNFSSILSFTIGRKMPAVGMKDLVSVINSF